MTTDPVGLTVLACLGFIFVVGTVLNFITMYVLIRDEELAKKLASVRWLVFGDSLLGFLVCFVGDPLDVTVAIRGDVPPFSTVPILCAAGNLLVYGLMEVSYWYQAVIAVTRSVAVLAPSWYRRHMKRSSAKIVLFVMPWAVVACVRGVSAAARAYRLGAAPGTGTCLQLPYDNDDSAADRYAAYGLSDVIITQWTPMAVSLSCYVVIFAYKWWKQRNKKMWISNLTNSNRVQPVSASIMQNKNIGWKGVEVAATTVNLSALATTTKNKMVIREKLRYQKIKFLAAACAVNFAIVFPAGFIYSFGFYMKLEVVVPAFNQFLNLTAYIPFLTSPLLYLLLSADFRQAYRRLFKRG